MQIIIHRGSHEIGGNCIEVATGGTHLILDVGMPLFGPDRDAYEGLDLPRKSKSELEATGILPKVAGLFQIGNRPSAVLISHAHQDHTGLLRHTHVDIPIFASRGTSKMMDAGYRFAGQPYLPRSRFREVIPQISFSIDQVKITGFSVDHSIYGALAFLIEAEDKRILYSGDLRMHGRKPGMMRTLLAALHNKPIDVLLMEGTHIGHPEYLGMSEYELEDTITDMIQTSPGIVLASFSPQHVDRLVAFLRATRKAGRTFVADAYTGYILHLLRSEIPVPAPDSSEWIRIFFPMFFKESFERKRLESVFSLFSPGNIELEEIRAAPSKFTMMFRPSMLRSDFGGILPTAARCIFSRWHGYLDKPDWDEVKEALAAANGELLEAHTSGHIYASDIVEVVRQINPALVIPIHTFEPEKFSAVSAQVRVLVDGEIFSF